MQKTALLSRPNIYLYTIGVCCLAETLCFSYLQRFPVLGVFTSLLYFISGLGICLLSMLFAVKIVGGKNNEPPVPERFFRLPKVLIVVSFFVFICVLLFQFGDRIFPAFPIDYHKADMLPLLQTACQRWLGHEKVYTVVKEVWGGENIPYLPAMWMPFAPSLMLNADIRWTSIVFAMASILILLVILTRLRYSARGILTGIILLGIFMIFKFYTWEDSQFFELSEEAIPAFYFTLLFVGLMYESEWITGIALALCTLSRFSLLPFVPFFFLWLLFSREFKSAIITGLIYGAIVLVLFILPFFLEQPQYFLDIPHNYTLHLSDFWKVRDYTLLGTRDLGLAYVFGYEYRELMSAINNVLLIAIPAAWLAAFIILKRRGAIHKNIWAMAGLKLSLLIFYNFIGMPYLYIFVVPTLVSYPLLLAIARETEQ